MLTVTEFSDEYPELSMIYIDESFEVDGIIYNPPWKRVNAAEIPIHYQPMFDIKSDVWCEQDGDLCTCDAPL